MKRSIFAAVLAVCSMLAAPVVSADGICLCGMKRPLVADISPWVPRPLSAPPVARPAVVADGIIGGAKRPLFADGCTVVHRPLFA